METLFPVRYLHLRYAWEIGLVPTQVIYSTCGQETGGTISHMRWWINRQIVIAVANLNFCILRISRLSIPLQEHNPEWESGSSLVLAQ